MSSVITAAITAGAMIGYWQVNPPRPNPFTSIDANTLRLEMERKIAESERRMVQRMTVIERNDENMAITQRQMWQVINSLPPDRWRRRIEGMEIWIIKQDETYDVPE